MSDLRLSKKKKRTLVGLGGVLAVFVVSGILWAGMICGPRPSFCLVYLYMKINDPFSGEKFNREKWISYHPSEAIEAGRVPHPRQQMARDVKTMLLRMKVTRDEVNKHLGPGDREDGEFFASYDIGFYIIDYYSLDVYFDKSGVIEKVAITQH